LTGNIPPITASQTPEGQIRTYRKLDHLRTSFFQIKSTNSNKGKKAIMLKESEELMDLQKVT